jgi:hypothetical protein
MIVGAVPPLRSHIDPTLEPQGHCRRLFGSNFYLSLRDFVLDSLEGAEAVSACRKSHANRACQIELPCSRVWVENLRPQVPPHLPCDRTWNPVMRGRPAAVTSDSKSIIGDLRLKFVVEDFDARGRDLTGVRIVDC